MNWKKWTVRLGAPALAAALLCTGAALAAGGDEDDPLVTLSYLNETAIPQIVAQVEKAAAPRQEEMVRAFAALVAQYKAEAGSQTPGGGAGGASYTLVTLPAGRTMSLEVGCEVLLRVGSASVRAGTSPALIDTTTGGTLDSGGQLVKNHLYMATIPDRTLTAGAAEVKLLVRGGYTVV